MSIYLPIAETSINMFALIAIGLGVGFLSGLFGISGGFLITPILIFFHIPPAIAVGTAANQAVASASMSSLTHIKNGTLDIKLAIFLVIAGFFGAYFGVETFGYLKQQGNLDIVILLLYVFLLGSIGFSMMIEALKTYLKKPAHNEIPDTKRSTILTYLPLQIYFKKSQISLSILPLLMIGLLVGFLSSIMGIGGGFLIIPLLTYWLKIPLKLITGTSLFQVACISIATTILQATFNQSVDIILAFCLMLGAVIGAQIGTKFSYKLRPEPLRFFLALLILSLVFKLAFEVLLPPSHIFSVVLPLI